MMIENDLNILTVKSHISVSEKALHWINSFYTFSLIKKLSALHAVTAGIPKVFILISQNINTCGFIYLVFDYVENI
jgi:hypothetical protein